MSGLISSAHSRSTISSWVSTEYAETALLHITATNNSASMRIQSVRQRLAIALFTANPASLPGLNWIRSSCTPFHTWGFEACLVRRPAPLRLADVNVGERLHQPEDVQQPQHNGYHHHSVQY